MDSAHFVRVLMRSWLILGLFAIAGAAGGLLVYVNTVPQYESSVQLVVSAPTAKGVDPLTQRALVVDRAEVVAQVASKRPAVADATTAAGHAGAAVSVDAAAQANAPFVTIVVRGGDPGVVRSVADSYSDSLPRTVARVESDSAGSRVTVSKLGPASFSNSPYTPKLLTNLLPGLAAGLVFGGGLVILRELLNQSAQSADELESLTGLRMLATVPRELPKVAVPTVDAPRSMRAEAYRQIRTALLTSAGPHARAIAVTSSLAREGKTSVSTNLAIALARAGVTVALVDADLHRPQVGEFLGITATAGLIDVLSGSAELSDALVPMEDGGLQVLTGGRGLAEPSELLWQDAFDELVKRLSAEHQFVIVDTPPVLPVADALVIAPRMDGVVLVAQLGRTRRDEIRRARTSIDDAGVPILGIVANLAARAGGRRYRYEYGSSAPIRGKHGIDAGARPKAGSAATEPSRPRPAPRPGPKRRARMPGDTE